MLRSITANRALRLLTAAALLTAPQAMAEDQSNLPAVRPATVDVMLGNGGVLQGYVVDAQGVPVAKAPITLTTETGEAVVAIADAKGRFGFRGLEGAGYQLHTERGVVNCRAWAAAAAPPQSSATLLLVHDDQLVRGQWAAPPAVNGSVSRLKRAMTNPFFVATVVGAAVAIPVAIHNADEDNSGS